MLYLNSRRFANSQTQTGKLRRLSISNVFQWRWTSIVLLGVVSNTLVNMVLDLKYNRPLISVDLEEYLNAIIAAALLLEGTRWISRKLDSHVSWEAQPKRRLLIQLVLHFLFVAVVLNAALLTVTYIFYGGIYGAVDLLIIDLTVLLMTFLFSSVDTGIAFYRKPKPDINSTFLKQPPQLINVTLSQTKHFINPADVLCALSDSGMVSLYTTQGTKYLYDGSLDSLMTLLDANHFFRANRQSILSMAAIRTTKSLPQGKIQLTIAKNDQAEITLVVSRTKAASFRRWVRSQQPSH